MEYQFTDRCQPRLHVAYYSLLKLMKFLRKQSKEEGSALAEECQDLEEPIPELFKERLDAMLSLMESILDMPKLLRASCITWEDLSKLKIRPVGYLTLKTNWDERVTETTRLGEDEFWSSFNLYRHLQLLERQIPKRTIGSGRAWIEALFFRVSAMLNDKRMIISNETDKETQVWSWRGRPIIAESPIAAGSTDYYTVILDDNSLSTEDLFGLFSGSRNIYGSDSGLRRSGFFTIADIDSFDPWKQTPCAIMEMYTCGVQLRSSKILRGALTNGRQWVFIIMKFDDDYNNAFYMQSEVVQLMITRNLDGEVTIHKPWPDVIAAILTYWIENSTKDFGNDDWFERAREKQII